MSKPSIIASQFPASGCWIETVSGLFRVEPSLITFEVGLTRCKSISAAGLLPQSFFQESRKFAMFVPAGTVKGTVTDCVVTICPCVVNCGMGSVNETTDTSTETSPALRQEPFT